MHAYRNAKMRSCWEISTPEQVLTRKFESLKIFLLRYFNVRICMIQDLLFPYRPVLRNFIEEISFALVIFFLPDYQCGAWGGVVVKALHYQLEVPGSIPGCVTGLFSDIILPTVTVREPHHFHVLNVMEIWEPKPPGTLWATKGLLRDSKKSLPLYLEMLAKQDSFIIICPGNWSLVKIEQK